MIGKSFNTPTCHNITPNFIQIHSEICKKATVKNWISCLTVTDNTGQVSKTDMKLQSSEKSIIILSCKEIGK